MSLTLKLAKRREGVGEESDDKLHSPNSNGDGRGVGGGVGEALESLYIPHSLFVGSAAPANVAMASLHLFSCDPLDTAPHPPLPRSTPCCLRCAPIPPGPSPCPGSWGRYDLVPIVDTPNIGIGHNSFECGRASCTSSTEGGGRWCIGTGGGGGWWAVRWVMDCHIRGWRRRVR